MDDLVSANAENSPEVPKEELEKYRSKSGLHLPRWLKVVLLKAWFAGAACSISPQAPTAPAPRP